VREAIGSGPSPRRKPPPPRIIPTRTDRHPHHALRAPRMRSSASLSCASHWGAVGMSTRKRKSGSANSGSGSPAAQHAPSIRPIPVPRCSQSPKSWNTRAITRLRTRKASSRKSAIANPAAEAQDSRPRAAPPPAPPAHQDGALPPSPCRAERCGPRAPALGPLPPRDPRRRAPGRSTRAAAHQGPLGSRGKQSAISAASAARFVETSSLRSSQQRS
jgi:hypothetical protein